MRADFRTLPLRDRAQKFVHTIAHEPLATFAAYFSCIHCVCYVLACDGWKPCFNL